MQIFVKTINGRSIALDVEGSDTVEKIKPKLQEKLDIPPEQQRIVYLGKLLENNRALCDYNIKKDSTILVLRIMK